MALSVPVKVSSGAIASLPSLCSTLGLSEDELNYALSIAESERYTPKEVSKAGGKVRVVFNPHIAIRRVQRRINERIFSNPHVISWPDYLYGSIPNQMDGLGVEISKDYISCAARHCGARSILKLDVESFFDNIQDYLVLDIFSEFLKCSPDVAQILTNLCCYQGRVVQGALTSSYLASLCLYDVEGTVAHRLSRKGLTYTRLVDDITVSSCAVGTDFSYAVKLITDMLVAKDLPVNETKTRVMRVSTEPLTVHGLRVNFSSPRLPADEVGRIRAAVRNIESLAKESNYRTSHSYRHDFNRCVGRVNKLQRVGHDQHLPLLIRLKRVMPLPSPRDIGRAKDMVDRLSRDYSARKHTYWYRARYYRVQERLNVLRRTYWRVADELRGRLKELQPE